MSREKSKEQRRATIIRAAAEAFKDRRFDEVKLDEIAKRAGVGKGTLYLYFKNKEELFVELAGAGTTEMATRIREITAMDVPYRERLALFVTDFVGFAEEKHGWMRMMMQSSSTSLKGKVRPKHEQVKAAVLAFLEQGVKEGAVRDDVPVDVLECLLIGSLFFRQRQVQAMKREIDEEQLLQCFWDAAQRREG